MHVKLWFLKIKNELFLVLIFILLINLFKFDDILFLPPRSIHQWRQCDAYSIIENYYYEGFNFFEPKLHFQGSLEGKAVGEFPILYFINALIWKFTGPNYLTIRLLSLIIYLAGLYNLYKLSFKIIRRSLPSIVIPILIFASPVLSYYSISYMNNVSALSLMFIAWNSYYDYFYSEDKRYKLIRATIIVTFSILLRPTLIMGIVPILFLTFLSVFQNKNTINIKKNIFQILLLILPFLMLIIWIDYAKKYNQINDSIYFLLDFRPIWNAKNVLNILDSIKERTLFEIYPKLFMIIIFVSFLVFEFLLLINKKMKQFILLNSMLLITILYCTIWFENLDAHDYYFIDCFVFISIYYIMLFHFLQTYKFSKGIIYIFSIGLFGLIFYSASLNRLKYYSKKSPIITFFIDDEKIKFYDWFHWNYDNTVLAYEGSKPYLRKLGIKRTDFVLSTRDLTPNVSLSLMDVKGVTNFYNENKSTEEILEKYKNINIKYLISNSTNVGINKRFKKIGQFKNLSIFKIIK